MLDMLPAAWSVEIGSWPRSAVERSKDALWQKYSIPIRPSETQLATGEELA